METARNPNVTWLLFCRRKLRASHLQWTCLSSRQSIEAEFAVVETGYEVTARGSLLGSEFTFEASSRRRLDGDEQDSHVPLFVGRFEHDIGPSGDFTIRPKSDGELMTVGLYGAPQSISVRKISPELARCPLEVHGIPEADIRFEDTDDPFHALSIPESQILARSDLSCYVGWCNTPSDPKSTTPPMISVLVTLSLAYELLLSPYHLRVD